MNTFKNKKILITGGLGFIGSNLAQRLVKEEADVHIIDSLIPDYGGNRFNIENIKEKVIVNISDVRDKNSIEQLVKEFKAKKEELETELAEKEIGTMDTQEFERVFPAKPYADDMPEKPRPIDKVVKRRWDKRKPA